MFAESEIAFPGRELALPVVLVHTNAVDVGLPEFAEASLQRRYRPQGIRFDPVRIGRLPPGCTLYGDRAFWLESEGRMAIEQINPAIADLAAVASHLQASGRELRDVVEPCLLVARYGDVTWGHWLCELLPRAVAAEHFHPGRFRYAVPAGITETTPTRSFSTSVLESLAAYGIGEDRLLRLDSGFDYRFRELHAVSGVWTSATINPDLLDIVRSDLPAMSDVGRGRRTAVLRQGGSTRQIWNMRDVTSTLTAHGFRFVDPGALSFMGQVDTFRASDTIFGVLGSGMSGLMFSPDAVKVVSAAPGSWPDAYFYPFMQHRGAAYVDLRGPALWAGDGLERDAPFLLPPVHLSAGLEAMQAEPPMAWLSIGAVTVPRRLHEVVVEIDFAATGNSAEFRRGGWSAQEPVHVWSEGPVSHLTVTPLRLDEDLVMEISLFALVSPPHLVSRRLDVEVNGTPVGSFSIADCETVFCHIPAACVPSDDPLELAFRHPFCIPAWMSGQGPDQRAISAAFISLKLRRA